MHDKDNIRRIIAAYDSAAIRLYVRIRFHILRQRFLREIGQYLPERGHILDVGCGFGLFSLFYAMLRPQAMLDGIDLNETRIACATRTAERLQLANVRYKTGSAVNLSLTGRYDAVYMLDIVHHIPAAAVEPLVQSIYGALPAGGAAAHQGR